MGRMAPHLTPLYENCRVLNKEGQLIFFTNHKRCQWYLQRNLAVILQEDPFTIQLNFQTNGNGNLGDDFYLQERANICVVCGTDQELTKHHIVPNCFRRWFPEELKNHSYHDILAICITHHEAYEQHALQFRRELEEEFMAPLNGVGNLTDCNRIHKARGYADNLLNHAGKIPSARQVILMDKIKELLQVEEFNLEEVAKMHPKYDGKTQGKLIVEQLENVDAFIQRWREHFVRIMDPKFLPLNWSVERRER